MPILGIAGLGTVGIATISLLQNQVNDLNLTLKCISARDKNKDRVLDLYAYHWCEHPSKMIEKCDIMVEVMGGTGSVVSDFVDQTLAAGKKLVTANKALLASRPELIDHPNIYFEAAVGGGIPMIRTVKDYLRGNQITSLQGILNGTCNYILTEMAEKGLGFDTALKQAQELGYAEADPTADIDGHDTAQKLQILCKLAFGSIPRDTPVQGIRGIEDARHIRLVAQAYLKDGVIQARVAPLDCTASPLLGISGVTNALLVDSTPLGTLTLSGPGAGGGATASAILADIIDASSTPA